MAHPLQKASILLQEANNDVFESMFFARSFPRKGVEPLTLYPALVIEMTRASFATAEMVEEPSTQPEEAKDRV
jgi:hypothetical protein